MKAKHATKLRCVLLAVTLLVTVGCASKNAFADVNDFMNLDSHIGCETPLVTLENGTDQISTIYTSNTSAKISVNATSTSSTYNYSLNIVNNNASLWEIRLEYFDYINIGGINTTLILHNNSTSNEQIAISGGNISQTDNYYNLTGNATIHLKIMNLAENPPEQTTILQTYLRLRTPNTTTTLFI